MEARLKFILRCPSGGFCPQPEICIRERARSQRWSSAEGGMVQNLMVYEFDTATGILDHAGRALVKNREPIGFDLAGKK